MKKSIFVLGASRLQVPAIMRAKEEGLFVYVLDYDPNAVGIQYADKFLEISTIDRELVYKAAVKYKPDYIITSTSDMPVRTVAWVNEKLGKPSDISFEGALCATDKVAMRNRMKECGVPIPEYHIIGSFDEFMDTVEVMPKQFILKPADNAASRGVVLLDKDKKPDWREVYEYCVKYSRSGKALVEEYMDGPEVSVESYTIDGEPYIIAITDKIVTDVPFFVELGHTEPSRLSVAQQDEIMKVATAAIKAVGMQNGPNHTEIKYTSDGAKLVEIAARLGGDFITSKLVPLSTGVDMIKCSFDTLLGREVDCKKKHSKGAAIRFIQGEKGKLAAVEGIDVAMKMPGVQEIEIYLPKGTNIHRPENSADRVGHVIAVGENAEEASANAEAAMKLISVVVE